MNVTDPSLKILIVSKIGKYKINIFGLFSIFLDLSII